MAKPEYTPPAPGETEFEFGVAIPGVIKAPAEWAHTAVKHLPAGALDWAALFGRAAPVVVELACGNARFTLASAIARPELNHFAADVLPAVVRYATRRANQRGLHNVRFAVKDAEALVREHLGSGSVAELHFYHPQPFHDHREARRRTITPRFLADVHRALQSGGLFVIQTDSRDYWKYMLKVLPAFFDFQERQGPWPDAPEGRSRREIIARSRGLSIFRGFGKRRVLSAAEIDALVKTLPWPTFHSRAPKGDKG